MTFPARLTELLEKATKGPWSVDPDDRPDMEWNNHIVQVGTDNTICFMAHDPRDNSGQQAAAELIVYLVNHAEALRDLVAAAEKLNYLSKGYSTERESHFIALSEALAKLEEQ